MTTDLPELLAQRISDATGVYPDGAAPLAIRAANALRTLATRALAPDGAPDYQLIAALEALAASADEQTRSRFPERPARHDGLPAFPMGTHPIAGGANVMAPPIEIDLRDDLVLGRVSYGPLYEGYPGSVFGGFIAAGFDALLGIRAALVGTPCSAVSLTTDFRAPAPLGVVLQYEASLIGVENRKIRVGGRLVDDSGALCAESTALFLAVSTDAAITDSRAADVRTGD